MRPQTVLSGLLATASAATNETKIPNVVPSSWDGHCYYPTSDAAFELDSYLGRWYQVAGTLAPFTAGCKCIFAQYALNVSPTTPILCMARTDTSFRTTALSK
jgi:apolipoprotein D and lipocalin family protein